MLVGKEFVKEWQNWYFLCFRCLLECAGWQRVCEEVTEVTVESGKCQTIGKSFTPVQNKGLEERGVLLTILSTNVQKTFHTKLKCGKV